MESNLKSLGEMKSAAKAAMVNSHSPYSGFKVAAAVETTDGKIYVGTNVENASYGLTICAERSAIFAAISNGSHSIKRIFIMTGSDRPVFPCGACRQVLFEFNPYMEVWLNGKDRPVTAKELLPYAFSEEDL